MVIRSCHSCSTDAVEQFSEGVSAFQNSREQNLIGKIENSGLQCRWIGNLLYGILLSCQTRFTVSAGIFIRPHGAKRPRGAVVPFHIHRYGFRRRPAAARAFRSSVIFQARRGGKAFLRDSLWDSEVCKYVFWWNQWSYGGWLRCEPVFITTANPQMFCESATWKTNFCPKISSGIPQFAKTSILWFLLSTNLVSSWQWVTFCMLFIFTICFVPLIYLHPCRIVFIWIHAYFRIVNTDEGEVLHYANYIL